MNTVNINEYNKFISAIFGKTGIASFYDPKDKKSNALINKLYFLSRTQQMFEWSGLPDTIPQRVLEMYLQINGFAAFAEHEGELYIYFGGLGGEPDVYYMPTIFTVANPAQHFSATLKINEDCIIIPNDCFYMGLTPMFDKYSSLLAENELSIYIADINARIVQLINATDDRTKASAELYLEKIKEGDLSVIASPEFFDGLRTQPYGATGQGNVITQLIELEQYLKASWFNEIGLNANYNMKRESINSGESQLNNDSLLPLVDDMLKQRQLGAERVNEMFGTNISVKLASSWEDNIQEIELEQEELTTNEEAVDVEPIEVSGDTSEEEAPLEEPNIQEEEQPEEEEASEETTEEEETSEELKEAVEEVIEEIIEEVVEEISEPEEDTEEESEEDSEEEQGDKEDE